MADLKVIEYHRSYIPVFLYIENVSWKVLTMIKFPPIK